MFVVCFRFSKAKGKIQKTLLVQDSDHFQPAI